MNFRYTYIGILNLDFYNKCCTLLLIIIMVVILLMGLSLLMFTRGKYTEISDLVTWQKTKSNDDKWWLHSFVDEYLVQIFCSNLGRLDFYVQSKLLNFMQRENESLEIGWTLLPVFILLLLLVPSLNLLFLMDNTKLPVGEEFRTWMVTGHQWYWEYKTIKAGSNIYSKVSIDIIRYMNFIELSFLLDTLDLPSFLGDNIQIGINLYKEFYLDFIVDGDKSFDFIISFL